MARRSGLALTGILVLTGVGGCLAVPPQPLQDSARALIAIALGVLGFLAITFVIAARRHRRLFDHLRRVSSHGELQGHDVWFAPGIAVAFVAGLRRPAIFCDPELPDRLNSDEIRAVILHEHHHQLHLAPLRLVLIEALAPFAGRMSAGAAWLARQRASIEIAADEHALSAGVARSTLASALIKLSTSPSLIYVPGFASAADLRLRALLDPQPAPTVLPRLGWAAGVAVFLVVGCLLHYGR